MAKHTKMDTINTLIEELNSVRKEQGKPEVTRCWTGVGHWLKRGDKTNYSSLGGIFTNDNEFIGFLRGLLFVE